MMGAAKWATGGLGLVALALGVTFNRLAAAKSDDLESMIKGACPPGAAPTCEGNAELNWPVVRYSKDHLRLELEIDQYNELAVASFIVGGAAAAASVTLFVLDWLGVGATHEGAARKVSISPVFDGRSALLHGEVRF